MMRRTRLAMTKPEVPPASRVYTSVITLSATGAGATGAIVGSAAGSLGHASGVTAVAAVANKRIDFVGAAWRYTYATAAYTDGGGNVSFRLADNPSFAIVGGLTSASIVGTVAGNRTGLFSPTGIVLTSGTTTSGIGAALIVACNAALTNPGGATGTVTITVYYRLLGS